MRRLTGLGAVRRAPTRAVVTVGVFDGVHLAHRRLIQTAVRLARRRRGTAVAVTFDPDPHAVLQPRNPPLPLMSLRSRLAHLEALGIDWAWVIPFTTRFSRTTAAGFVRRLLVGRLRATALIVGHAFVFGRGRRGDTRLLERLGVRYGMRIIPVGPIRLGGQPVSSSRIRRLIEAGQLARARRLLGHVPTLSGTVTRGAGRGRRLGVPTANLRLPAQVLPPAGVYAVRVRLRGRPRPGVMNLGRRPTFGAGPVVCEIHVLGFSGHLLNRELSVDLVARLRAERRFPTPRALTRQIARDIARARRLI